MSLKIKKSASAGIHIDEGEYIAVVEGIQINKWEDGNESYGWTFKVKNATLDGDPVDGVVRIRSFATAILTPKSKLFKWAKGAGLDVENDDEVDLEEAIGKTVRIDVEDHETKDGTTVSKVEKVRPVKKKVKEDTDEDEKPAKKSKDKPKAKKKPVEEDEEETEEEEEEEEPPKKKKAKEKVKPVEKKKAKKASDDDEEEEDELFNFSEDDDEDDDE
jgi:hypothetical protein